MFTRAHLCKTGNLQIFENIFDNVRKEFCRLSYALHRLLLTEEC